jgi:ABC-type Na+ efflux pump permease subunit
MVREPILIIQVPRGGAVERQLSTQPPPSVAGDEVVVEIGTTDAEGNLESPAGGEVVLSLPSPEALAREADEVRRVLTYAGTGVEPLVVEVEVAEELRDEELAGVLAAAGHAPRPVILRIIRNP